ncbi:M48 family metallopeptidase [Rhizobium johnstonii]|uniref:M48 family metallopeptidase n=1 Tax=Rhizobium johnstonii TaxID=3019933 RepID=UPI003F9559CE
MINPNDYPSSTNVRFLAMAASACMMAIWYGYQLPHSLAFINLYLDRPVSAFLAFVLVVIFWGSVAVAYFVFHSTAEGRPAQNASEHQLIADATAIAAEMGLPRVGFSFGEELRSSDMAAYGPPWKRRVFIQRGVLLYRTRFPEKFRARLCHELGHVRNRDVDSAVLSLAILYTAYIFVAGFVGFWTCQFVTHFHRLAADSVVLFTFVSYGLPVYIASVAWVALFWIENRAFVRQREFMADAEAAYRVGPTALEGALAKSTSDGAFKLKDRVKWFFRVHPSIPERLSSIRCWPLAGLPKASTTFVVGAIWGLFLSVVNSVANQYGEHDKLLDWNIRNDADGAGLMEIFSSSAYLFDFILSATLALLLLSATTGLAIRTGVQHRVTGTPLLKFIWKVVVSSVALVTGLSLGVNFDPISLQTKLATVRFDLSGVDLKFLFVAALFALTACVSYAGGWFLMGGRRVSPVSGIEWFLLALFFYAVVAQVSATVVVALFWGDLLVQNWINVASFGGMLLFYGFGLAAVVYRIRNGSRATGLKTGLVVPHGGA